MVAVFNSSLARSSRVALAVLSPARWCRAPAAAAIDPRRPKRRDAAELRHRGRRIHEGPPRNPNSRDARQGLERAKLRASQDHFPRAPSHGDRQARRSARRVPARRRAQSRQRRDRARVQDTRTQLRAKIAIREDGKTRLETLIAQSLDAPLPGADLPADAKLPDTVVFRDASAATSSPRSASSRT